MRPGLSSVEAPLTSHEINVDATLDVLGAARQKDARIVLTSSAAIDGHLDQVPIQEDDPKTPSSRYGLAKLTIDHDAQQYHELYGLETVALRSVITDGPG